PRLVIAPRADKSENRAGLLVDGDKNAFGGTAGVLVDVSAFAPLPVAALDRTEHLLDSLVDRDAVKGIDGNPPDRRQVGRLEGADGHAKCRLRQLDAGSERRSSV